MLNKNIKRVLAVVMLSSIATFAFAEDAAPVYDADNYPPQFDGQTDAGLAPDTASASNTTQNAYNAPAPAPTLSMTVDQRVARVEQQISNLEHKDLANKMDTLQNDIQSLRGQVEELNHQLLVAQKSQPNAKSDAIKGEMQTLHAQVDQLSLKIEQLQSPQDQDGTALKSTPSKKELMADSSDDTTVSTQPLIPAVKTMNKTKLKQSTIAQTDATTLPVKTKTKLTSTNTLAAANKATDQQPNVAEEQQIYQTAYDLIKSKKYNEAINALQKMLHKYPTGQFAANAHYWLGELYGLLGKNDQSAVEFDHVAVNFPDSPKVADAQLKLGLIYAAQFKWVDAKGAFKKVINHYPGTASARLASQQLKQIKEAGH